MTSNAPIYVNASTKQRTGLFKIKLITTVAVPFNSVWGLGALLSCIMSAKPGYVEPPSQYRPQVRFIEYVTMVTDREFKLPLSVKQAGVTSLSLVTLVTSERGVTGLSYFPL